MKAIATWALRRLDKKDWREAVLASLPENGRKEERIRELVAFGLNKHVHANPKRREKNGKDESAHQVSPE